MSNRGKRADKGTKPSLRRCKVCTRGGVERTEPAADGRPRFKCSACGDTFTCGKSGGEYAAAIPEKATL